MQTCKELHRLLSNTELLPYVERHYIDHGTTEPADSVLDFLSLDMKFAIKSCLYSGYILSGSFVLAAAGRLRMEEVGDVDFFQTEEFWVERGGEIVEDTAFIDKRSGGKIVSTSFRYEHRRGGSTEESELLFVQNTSHLRMNPDSPDALAKQIVSRFDMPCVSSAIYQNEKTEHLERYNTIAFNRFLKTGEHRFVRPKDQCVYRSIIRCVKYSKRGKFPERFQSLCNSLCNLYPESAHYGLWRKGVDLVPPEVLPLLWELDSTVKWEIEKYNDELLMEARTNGSLLFKIEMCPWLLFGSESCDLEALSEYFKSERKSHIDALLLELERLR